jgi:O-methyltransferase
MEASPLDFARARSGFSAVWLHRLMASSRLLRGLTLGVMSRLELTILSGHKEDDVLDAIKAARRERESLLSGNEAFTVFSMARAQSAMPGSMAEVGVYQGCSAKIISIASRNADLHLFDTFKGLPEPSSSEKARLWNGLYAAELPSVQAFLSDRKNISFHPGLFPRSAESCPASAYSFVHLDVDLQSSTFACLDYFYPRMLPGGIILSHDYSYLHGVKTAFAEFLGGRPEQVIELPTSQAMLVKR